MDLAVGSALRRMYFSIETGTSGAMINHLTSNEYDVYIMGASAAQHGYIPEIIERETGLTVYNAGEDATNIFYKYAVLQLILKHHKPKMIIWDLLDIDYFSYPEYSKTNLLKPYYNEPQIYAMLKEVDPLNVFLKVSKIYPYNQKIAAILTEYFKPPSAKKLDGNGYLPVYGEIDLKVTGLYPDYVRDNLKALQEREQNLSEADELVRKYFRLFIKTCKDNNIQIIAFCSPRCPVNPELASTPIISRMLLEEMDSLGIGVEYILPSQYPELYRTDIFKDLGHLNNKGAQVFSKIVAKKVNGFTQTSISQ